MELDLGSKTVYMIKVNGEKYEMERPTLGQSRKFRAELQSVPKDDEDAQYELTRKFMASLGLPEDVFDNLTDRQMELLQEGLKKN